jgi:transcriptional regulator with XRE-family HTH domain
MIPLPLLLARLGRVVCTLRKQAGYSQDRFASAVGVHRTYMGLLERGKTNPTLKILDQVAQRLGMDVVELLVLTTAESNADASARAVAEKHHLPGACGLGVGRRRGTAASSPAEPPGPKRVRQVPGK